jgi:hypothetical protein
MPEEVRFFVRTAAFGFALGAIYWLVSHDPIGTVFLLGFGGAAAMLAVVLAVAVQKADRPITGRPWRWLGLERTQGPPIGTEPERLPTSTATPLIAGAGLALAALSLAYGPIFLVAAAPPLMVAGVRWVGAASREWVGVERDDPG